MLNSSILDLAMGLGLLYLLMALICTTVNEWIAQATHARAATLREGIGRLLHAPPCGTHLIRPVDINVAALTKRFSNPADKLTLAVGAREPEVSAYVDRLIEDPALPPPPGLAGALADQLNKALEDKDLNTKIDNTKVTQETRDEFKKEPKNNDLKRLNRALLSEAYPNEIASLSDAFFNHPLIKSLARQGEYPSYIPAKTFALTLMDIFRKGQAAGSVPPLSTVHADISSTTVPVVLNRLPDGVWRATPALSDGGNAFLILHPGVAGGALAPSATTGVQALSRTGDAAPIMLPGGVGAADLVSCRAAAGLAQIKTAIASLPESEVKMSVQALLGDGIESAEGVQQKLEEWFEDSMDQVSGWYKKKTRVWTVVIASIVTILVNADTLNIAQKLMINPALREKIAQEAAATARNNQSGTPDAATPWSSLTEQQKAELNILSGWTDDFRTFHRLEFKACVDNAKGDSKLLSACRKEADKANDLSFPGTDLLRPVRSRGSGP